MEIDFIKFASNMGESSRHLIDKDHYHNGVYLGGYCLEGYLKYILVEKMDYSLEKIKIHLNQQGKESGIFLHKEVEKFLKLHSELILDSLLLSGNKKYPKFLINGGSNKKTQFKWNVEKRYEINQWNEKEHALKIKREIEAILNEMLDLYLTEGGKNEFFRNSKKNQK